jgi:hypothetical protein
MNYVVMGTAGLVWFLWNGGQQGWAIIALILGVCIYFVELAMFDMAPCQGNLLFPCQQGKIWSPLGGTFRRHKACGGSGFRQRFGRRLWDRNK